MLRLFLRSAIVAAAGLAVALMLASRTTLAQSPAPCGNSVPWGQGYGVGRNGFVGMPNNSGICRNPGYGRPDLFYNFYVPGRCGGVPAGMYPAPRPIPPNVGLVYYTYQPLMPHEMMYRHRRQYYNLYDGGRGLNHTTVSWW